MVATVGSISIDLSTNAAKFASGFKASATTVEQQSSRMAKAVNGISSASKAASGIFSGFIGGLVAGGVLTGLASLTGALGKAREAISELDDIATNAKNVGLTTDSYQALAFGAKLANVEQETFNKSLEIFAKNAGLAEHGTGALYAGLAKLNPALLQSIINAKDQRERLALVADALHNTNDATEKAALATTIFGKAGIGLIPVLDGGASSLDKMEQQAKELGIAFDKDLFEKVGPLDDKLDFLSKVIDTQLKSALINLAPLLVAGSQALADFATKINDVTKAIDGFANSPSLAAFDKIRQQFLTIDTLPGTFADSIRHAFADAAGGADDLQRQIAAVEREIADTIQGINELKATDAEIDTTLAEKNLASLNAQLDTLRAKLQEQLEIKVDTSAARQHLADLAQAFRESENASMKALDALTGGGGLPIVHGSNIHTNNGPTTSTVNGVNVTKFGQDDKQILRDIKSSIDDGSDTQDQGFQDTTDAVDQNTDATRKLAGPLDDIFGGLTNGFSGLQRSVDTGTDEIRQLVQNGIPLDYASIEAAVRTGFISGRDDSLLGQKFTSDYTNWRDILTKPTSFAGAFADGGSFTVGGMQSGDKNMVSLLANDGETVTVSPKGQSPGNIIINYAPPPGESMATSEQRMRTFLNEAQRAQSRA